MSYQTAGVLSARLRVRGVQEYRIRL